MKNLKTDFIEVVKASSLEEEPYSQHPTAWTDIVTRCRGCVQSRMQDANPPATMVGYQHLIDDYENDRTASTN